MARRDYITIGIIVICLAALIFFIYKTITLMTSDQTVALETPSYEADDSDLYEADAEILPEEDGSTSTDEEKPTDGDYDDDELSYDPEEESEETSREPTRTYDEDNNYEDLSTATGMYLVIAGSYRQEINADNQLAQIRKLGYGNAAKGKFNKGAYAVVLVDRFDSKSDASALVEELKEEHDISAYVIQN